MGDFGLNAHEVFPDEAAELRQNLSQVQLFCQMTLCIFFGALYIRPPPVLMEGLPSNE